MKKMKKMKKYIMPVFIIIACLIMCSCATTKEESDNSSATDTGIQETTLPDTSESTNYGISEKDAIYKVANHVYFEDEVKKWTLFKTITRGEIVDTEVVDEDDRWYVTLKCRVSGYEDVYKTEFDIKKLELHAYVDKETGFVRFSYGETVSE